MDIVQISCILALIITLIIFFYKQKFQYWKNRNVPNLPPNIPFGHSTIFPRGGSFINSLTESYKKFRRNKEKHFGLYTFFRPVYIPLDLEIIKNILTKDFQYFNSRGLYYNEKSDPLSAHLVTLDGELWRNLRVKLTPTFTSGKMKNMFPIFIDCADQMIEAISKMTDESFDVKEVMGCYTIDVIGNCAFGLNCNSFKRGESEFKTYAKKALKPSVKRMFTRIFVDLFPKVAKRIGTKIVHPEVSRFFMKTMIDTIDYRKGNYRNDFLQNLIDLKNNNGISTEEIVANCFVFFLAGFDTSATTMSFALYELSKNEEIQNRARDEIFKVFTTNNDEFSYESLKKIKYLDQIIEETLRLYAPAPLTVRRCTKDYKIPDTDTIIEKGVRVIVPIFLMHTDKEYFENPEEFNPDRFSEEEKPKVSSYSYLPFGEGPRNCIGSRFGLMQTKLGLALLLKSYKFTLNSKTKQPLVFNPRSVILTTMDPIYLNAEKLL